MFSFRDFEFNLCIHVFLKCLNSCHWLHTKLDWIKRHARDYDGSRSTSTSDFQMWTVQNVELIIFDRIQNFEFNAMLYFYMLKYSDFINVNIYHFLWGLEFNFDIFSFEFTKICIFWSLNSKEINSKDSPINSWP